MICSSPSPAPPLDLDELPLRPQVRRWARATVRELLPLVSPCIQPGKRLLALFIDGLGSDTLARGARDGSLPFLGALRDSRQSRLAPAFSGMPSTTTAFQAGLFYGLPHPDVPAFGWLDRADQRVLHMNRPADARQIEARITAQGGPGLMEGGRSYLSILRGGSADRLNTAGVGAVLAGDELPLPQIPELPALASIHLQTAVALAARLAFETGGFLWDMFRFIQWSGTRRHEGNFLLNHLLVGTLVREVAQGQAILDLVAGVPRIFLNLHDFDEASHRRGPLAATHVLRRLDRSVEMLYAIAAASPNPPDVWVFSDHGQIAAAPIQQRFGFSLAEWLRGIGDRGPPPAIPAAIASFLGVPDGSATRLSLEPRVVEAGNYAHIYFGGSEPLDSFEIAGSHAVVLARLLACPAVGLVAMRHRGGAAAFAGSRWVDPDDPATIPNGVSPRAVAALLDDLAHSPSSGDLVAYGAWMDDGCIAFSQEFSSHGGPSTAETGTFVIHPADLPFEPPSVGHGADLHGIFHRLYGDRSDRSTGE